MIVNDVKTGWEIIFQRNHALLAGKIAYQIDPRHRPPYWLETLSAIIEHDDGQRDWHSGKYISEEGKPLDFTTYKFDAEQAERVVEEARFKSKWIALLVSRHTTALYSPIKNKAKELTRFLKAQEELQAELRKDLGLDKIQMDKYYGFLRWCDECSLILCQNRCSDGQRIEVGNISEEGAHYMRHIRENVVEVSPWCFRNGPFEVSAEVYQLNTKKFNSTEAFRQCLENQKPFTRTWKFQDKSF